MHHPPTTSIGAELILFIAILCAITGRTRGPYGTTREALSVPGTAEKVMAMKSFTINTCFMGQDELVRDKHRGDESCTTMVKA